MAAGVMGEDGAVESLERLCRGSCALDHHERAGVGGIDSHGRIILF